MLDSPVPVIVPYKLSWCVLSLTCIKKMLLELHLSLPSFILLVTLVITSVKLPFLALVMWLCG